VVICLVQGADRLHVVQLMLLHPRTPSSLKSRLVLPFWYRLTQVVLKKKSLDLNEARDDGVLGRQWHQLDHLQTICTSLQTDNHTNTS